MLTGVQALAAVAVDEVVITAGLGDLLPLLVVAAAVGPGLDRRIVRSGHIRHVERLRGVAPAGDLEVTPAGRGELELLGGGPVAGVLLDRGAVAGPGRARSTHLPLFLLISECQSDTGGVVPSSMWAASSVIDVLVTR
jgi:hypothetical protein